jgi:hypothetical protein
VLAVVLGFPLLLMDAIRRRHPPAPNRLLALPALSAGLAPGLQDEDRRTARYSAWVDVCEGPVVVNLEDLKGRRFSLMAFDAWGDCIASVSSRFRPSAYHELAIVGSRWNGEAVARGTAARAPGDTAWVVARISRRAAGDLTGRLDEPAAPFLTRASAKGLERLEGGAEEMTPCHQDSIGLLLDLPPEEFFFRLGVLTKRHRPRGPCGRLVRVLHRLKWTMIKASAAGWGAAFVDALRDGRAAGIDMIARASERECAVAKSHWSRAGAAEHTSRARALPRAVQAWTGLGAPRPADLVQLRCGRDSADRPLRGDERYVIRFPVGCQPPANAFWELSALAENPAEAAIPMLSAIDSDSGLTLQSDGALCVSIQRQPPIPGAAVNWLRPPEGAFSLSLRLHWPTQAMISGEWRMPGVEQVPRPWPSARLDATDWEAAMPTPTRFRPSDASLR